jgi:hypothetical protein
MAHLRPRLENQESARLRGPHRSARPARARRGQLHATAGCPPSSKAPSSGPKSRAFSISIRPEPQRRRRRPATSNFVERLNREHLEARPGEADLEARIQSFELAARMQTAAKEALDISQESEATKKLYGIDNPDAPSSAPAASSPAASSSAACVSSRSSPGIRPGTSHQHPHRPACGLRVRRSRCRRPRHRFETARPARHHHRPLGR